MVDTQYDARPAQGRQEDQRGDSHQAGQSRFPLLSTEEYRLHAAKFLDKPQQRPESDGNVMELLTHSKVIANFFVLIILLLHHKKSFKGLMLRQNCDNAITPF